MTALHYDFKALLGEKYLLNESDNPADMTAWIFAHSKFHSALNTFIMWYLFFDIWFNIGKFELILLALMDHAVLVSLALVLARGIILNLHL